MTKLIILLAFLSSIATASTAGYPVFQTLRQFTYKTDYGTSFLATYRGKTYMITNWHVCRNFKNAMVSNEARGFSTTTKVLQAFPEQDLCLLTTEESSGIEIGTDLEVGYPIYIGGYPQYSKSLQLRSGHTKFLGYETLDYGDVEHCPANFSLRIELIPAKGKRPQRLETYCEHKQMIMDTDAEGTHGNSGSPVVNSKGKLVGVVHSSNTGACEATRTCMLNYIPVSELIKVLDLFDPKSP